MAQEPIRQRVEIEDEATEQLRAISEQEQQFAESTTQAGDAAEQAAPKQNALTRGLRGVFEAARSLAAPFAGIGALTMAYRAWREEVDASSRALERNAELIRQAAQAQRDLRFLSQDPDPEILELADELAVAAGRDPNEMRRTLADIRSRRPDADTDQLRSIGQRVAETALTTSAPTDAIANALLTVERVEPDARRAQNIMRQSIVDAGVSDPARISPLFSQFLTIGMGSGQMSAGEAAGAVAGATGLGMEPSMAVTGLRNVTLGLMGRATPEQARIRRQAGIDSSSFPAAIRSFGEAIDRGDVSNEQIEELFGREGLAFGSAMARPDIRESFLGAIERGGAAQQMEGSLTAEAIESQFGASARERLDLAGRTAETETQLLRENDPFAQRADTGRDIVERELEAARFRGEISAGGVDRGLEIYDDLIGRGFSVLEAARGTRQRTRAFRFSPRPGIDVPLGGAVAASDIGADARLRPGGGVPGGERETGFLGTFGFSPFDVSEPRVDLMADEFREFQQERGGNVINQINIGEQYNLSNDGRDRLTEEAPEEMD